MIDNTFRAGLRGFLIGLIFCGILALLQWAPNALPQLVPLVVIWMLVIIITVGYTIFSE